MTVIWVILELIFLFFFFELSPVDDFVKSKYEEHLERSYQQQQVQNSSDDKQNEADEKCVNTSQNIEEQNSNCDASLSACEQEQLPLLTSDRMKDIQASATSHRSITPPPQNFIKRSYWLLNG